MSQRGGGGGVVLERVFFFTKIDFQTVGLLERGIIEMGGGGGGANKAFTVPIVAFAFTRHLSCVLFRTILRGYCMETVTPMVLLITTLVMCSMAVLISRLFSETQVELSLFSPYNNRLKVSILPTGFL